MIFMSAPKCWLLGRWCSRERNVQQWHQPSGVYSYQRYHDYNFIHQTRVSSKESTNTSNVHRCGMTFMTDITFWDIFEIAYLKSEVINFNRTKCGPSKLKLRILFVWFICSIPIYERHLHVSFYHEFLVYVMGI